MKTTLCKALFGKNSTVNFAAIFIGLLIAGLACGGSAKPAPPAYVGSWTGADGSTMTIRADGGADYKSGSSSITGGSAVIDESAKTLKISFASLGPNFTIDKAPSGGQMTLSGVVYKSGGGSDTKSTSDSKSTSNSSSDSKSTSSSSGQIPSDDKLQSLVKSTMNDFSDAVQSGDFKDFHQNVAKVWQDEATPEEMKEAFKPFVDDKSNYNFKKAIASMDAALTPAPAMENVSGLDALVVKGLYPTSPRKTNFDLKYVMEDGSWKLIAIRINTKDQ